jgi:hypothetical protein
MFPPELIEESRRRLNIPADHEYQMCDNDCGELVWFPPGTKEAAANRPMPMPIVCSAACAQAWLKNATTG